MHYLNGMLIIASAFSVFGQFIDTSHRHEIQCLKDFLEGLNFDNSDEDDGLNSVKVQWDRLRLTEPLRAQFVIAVLAVYLVSLVAYFTIHSFGLLYSWWPVDNVDYVNNCATVWSGAILVIISVIMFCQVLRMTSQKKKFKDKCEALSVTLESIHKSIRSRKK